MRRFLTFSVLSLLVWSVSCNGSTTNTNSNASTDKINSSTNAEEIATESHKKQKDSLQCAEDKNAFIHEPPIGTGKGSFYLDLPVPFMAVRRNDPSAGMFKYVLGSTHRYTHIDCIAILTEGVSPKFDVYRYEVGDAVTLKLGLAVRPNDTPAANKTVDIGCDGNQECWVIVRQPFAQSDLNRPSKNHRKNRYSNNSAFSVVEWQITGNGGINVGESGDDMYQIYIQFGPHPTPTPTPTP